MRNHSPTGLFLCETKSHRERLASIGRQLQFNNLFVVDADSSKGILAFFLE